MTTSTNNNSFMFPNEVLHSNFELLAELLAKESTRLQKNPDGVAFNVKFPDDVSPIQVFQKGIPEGYNPIKNKAPWYQCNCCNRGLRDLLSNVHLINSPNSPTKIEVRTVFDNVRNSEYASVAEHLIIACEKYREFLLQANLGSPHFPNENHRNVGAKTTTSQKVVIDEKTGKEKFEEVTHSHFYGTNLVCFSNTGAGSADSHRSSKETDIKLLTKGFATICPEALVLVKEWIADNSLPRHEVTLANLSDFVKVYENYHSISTEQGKKLYTLHTAMKNIKVSRFVNSLGGTLLVDLSEAHANGKMAVKAEHIKKEFLLRSDSTSYQRGTTTVTQSDITAFTNLLENLGGEQVLNRTIITCSEVPTEQYLWMGNGLGTSEVRQNPTAVQAILAKNIKPRPTATKGTKSDDEISFQEFMDKILKESPKSLEIFMDRVLSNKNMVALIGPSIPNLELPLKWDNPYTWSYREGGSDVRLSALVAAKGGNVDINNALFNVRCGWFNKTDLDLHCELLKEGDTHLMWIYYNSPTLVINGTEHKILDVDANRYSDNATNNPVENHTYPKDTPAGVYSLYVRNYSNRSPTQTFLMELETAEGIRRFKYDNPNNLRESQKVDCLKVTVSKDRKVSCEIFDSPYFKEVQSFNEGGLDWGVKENDFAEVVGILKSPNCWGKSDDEVVGTPHTLFLLEGCCPPPDNNLSGFFREFLPSEFTQYKRPLEAVLTSLKVNLPSETQKAACGVGFSPSIPAKFKVRIDRKQIYTVVV